MFQTSPEESMHYNVVFNSQIQTNKLFNLVYNLLETDSKILVIRGYSATSYFPELTISYEIVQSIKEFKNSKHTLIRKIFSILDSREESMSFEIFPDNKVNTSIFVSTTKLFMCLKKEIQNSLSPNIYEIKQKIIKILEQVSGNISVGEILNNSVSYETLIQELKNFGLEIFTYESISKYLERLVYPEIFRLVLRRNKNVAYIFVQCSNYRLLKSVCDNMSNKFPWLKPAPTYYIHPDKNFIQCTLETKDSNLPVINSTLNYVLETNERTMIIHSLITNIMKILSYENIKLKLPEVNLV